MRPIRGDLHLHSSTKYCGQCAVTELSDLSGLCGCLPLNKLVKVARDEFGMEYLALSNHAFDPAVLDPDYEDARKRVLREANEIKKINKEGNLGIYLLSGVETNILPGGRLDVGDKTLSELEVVVAAKHLFPKEQTAKDIKNDFLTVLKNPFVTILGHPNRWIEGLSLEDWEKVFATAAANSIAIEINIRTPLSDELPKLALWSGGVFTLGSDTHQGTPSGKLYDRMNKLLKRLARLGLEEEQILNTYSLEALKSSLSRAKLLTTLDNSLM